jgi:ABC-2 type transport system permease protein
MGMSLILATLAVFFRDMVHLYSVIIFAWMYWTPVVYPISIIPDKYMWFIRLNPMLYIVGHFREALLDGKIPTLQMNLTCIISCIVTLAIGLFVFYKSQDKFVLYI